MPLRSVLKVLSLDTTTPRGSVSLLEGSDEVAELRIYSPTTHSARLLESVDYLFGCAGWTLGEIDLIAVCIGPGSFTGIRIGVATALGLAQSLTLPLACVSGLDAMAYDLRWHDGRLGIVMDAQRSQVYYAEYVAGRGKTRTAGKPALYYPSELAREIGRRRVLLAGDGAERYARELGIRAGGRRRLAGADLFLSSAVGRLAQKRRGVWKRGEYLTAEPLYIRPPDAMRKRNAAN